MHATQSLSKPDSALQDRQQASHGAGKDSLAEVLATNQHVKQHALQHGRQQVHGDADQQGDEGQRQVPLLLHQQAPHHVPPQRLVPLLPAAAGGDCGCPVGRASFLAEGYCFASAAGAARYR